MKHVALSITAIVLALVFCERPYTFYMGEAARVYISTWVTVSSFACKKQGGGKSRFRIPLEIKIRTPEKTK